MEDERSEVDALRRGDWRGLEALVRRHQSRAVRIAFAVLGDADLAQDVVAEAFLRVYERRSQFDPERPFAPWFTAIVRQWGAEGTPEDAPDDPRRIGD